MAMTKEELLEYYKSIKKELDDMGIIDNNIQNTIEEMENAITHQKARQETKT